MLNRVMLLQYLEMGRVCRVPLSYLINKGQQVKVFALILFFARKFGYIVPFTPRSNDDKMKGAVSEQEVTYQGATVIEPVRGFYTTPIVTLDFSSLYPSIMIARNLCYSTLLPGGKLPSELRSLRDQIESELQACAEKLRLATERASVSMLDVEQGLSSTAAAAAAAAAAAVSEKEDGVEDLRERHQILREKKKNIQTKVDRLYVPTEDGEGYRDMTDDDVFKSPLGEVFAKETTRKGILPMILNELLAARKRAKVAMAEAEDRGDTHMYSVFDKRQLAIKVSANSVYGFTGVSFGRLPCPAIAASVTSEGRTMIDDASRIAVETYETEFAAEHGGKAEVIYGDTDSVMVKFPCNFPKGPDGKLLNPSAAIQQSFEFAIACSKAANKFFPRPHNLEVEKAFYPYLLINKKRYAGGYYEWRPHRPPENEPEFIKTMGLETVRRDNAKMSPRQLQLVLDALMYDFSAERAIRYAQDTVAAILNGPQEASAIAQGCADAAHRKLLATLQDSERCGGTPYDLEMATGLSDMFHAEFTDVVMANYVGEAGAIDAIPVVPHSTEKGWVAKIPELLPEEAKSVPGIVEDLQEVVRNTLRLNVTHDDHVISQKWSRQLHLFKGKQPHIEMLKRMKTRAETGRDDIAGQYSPFLGDRLDFVIAGPSNVYPGIDVGDRAEDPRWAVAHDVLVDPVYYLRQFLQPVARILKPLVGSKSETYRRVMAEVMYKPNPDRGFTRDRFDSKDCVRIWGSYANGRRKRAPTPAVANKRAAAAEAAKYKAECERAAARGEEPPPQPKRARATGPLDAFFVPKEALPGTAEEPRWSERALAQATAPTAHRFVSPAVQAQREERAYQQQVQEARRLTEGSDDEETEVVIPERPTPQGPLDIFFTNTAPAPSAPSAEGSIPVDWTT